MFIPIFVVWPDVGFGQTKRRTIMTRDNDKQAVDIVWHRDRELGYRFSSVYLRGPMARSYARGDIEPNYPLPVPVDDRRPR